MHTPKIAQPEPGIDQTGFIDNSKGAPIYNRPPEAGGELVRDAPLPPAARVFASGTHPRLKDWWYVTAFVEGARLFAFEDNYSLGILQSSHHWAWTVAKGGKVTERIRYTNDVWCTFPWPQDPTEAQVVSVADAARRIRRVRAELMDQNGWSLRSLYQAAEIDGPHPLKDAQAALDAVVAGAYGIPSDQGPIEFLLELNQLVAKDEEQGRKVRGPGLPDHLAPKNPRWFSTDCIEPPPVES